MAATADVIITEIVDGTLPGGVPKFLELTNTGSSAVDLSGYCIANFNGTSTTMGGGEAHVLHGILQPCESFVISYENSDVPDTSVFFDVYGFNADCMHLGAFWNGDDSLVLYLADGSGAGGAATGDGTDATMVDIYGSIGTDGTGEDWEYVDSYSYRNCNINTANTTWTAGEWFVAGPNALEGADDAEEEQNLLDFTDPGVNCVESCGGTPVEDSTWGAIKRQFNN